MFRREMGSKRGSLPPKEGDLTCMGLNRGKESSHIRIHITGVLGMLWLFKAEYKMAQGECCLTCCVKSTVYNEWQQLWLFKAEYKMAQGECCLTCCVKSTVYNEWQQLWLFKAEYKMAQGECCLTCCVKSI